MRSVLTWRLPGLRPDLDGPLTVYATRDLSTSMRLHPKLQDPELPDFYGNWERNLAFVDLTSWSKSKQHGVFLGYTHEVLRQNSFVLPVWLDRGWTQLIGSIHFQDNQLLLGAPTTRWAELKGRPLLSVAHILQDKPLLGFANAGQFEREQQVNAAWGLVHYLTFAPGMQSGALLLNYYGRLQHGENTMTAFQAVFGDPAQMEAPFAAYVHAKSLAATVAPDLPAPDAASFQARALTAVEFADEGGILRIETHALADGRSAFERVLKSDPTDAVAHEELGVLAYDKGRLAEARQHWQAAAAKDSSRYVSRFALVMTDTPLREQSPEQRKEFLTELQRIVRLNPRFSPAFARIATLQWWQGSLDAAMRACEEAERLSPARDDYHLLHAQLLLAQHQSKAAAALARRISEKRATENEFDDLGPSFDTALLWQSIPAADRDTGASLRVPLQPGAQIARGTVVKVECGDSYGYTRFRVLLQADLGHGPENLLLTAGNSLSVLWDDTTWIGGGHNPVCFAAKQQPALAVYKPGSRGYGELQHFELRNDVPDLPNP